MRDNIAMEICRLYQPHRGEVVSTANVGESVDATNAVANVAEEAEEIEVEETGEEIEVNGYCNLCSANWTEEEERELQFLFYPCGHSYHYKCFGNYVLENIAGVTPAKAGFKGSYGAVRTIWRENTAQKCAIELVTEPSQIKEMKCMICKYFDFCNNSVNLKIQCTPDAKMKAIYKPMNLNNPNDSPIEIYYREKDIDELEQYFQLGEIICFQEAPQELYILDINMLKKPCFKKCAMNIIPYKFVQMFGYRYYMNSIYWPLITILPLDNEEKEYWDSENARVIRREYLDYEVENIPEVRDIEEDEETGTLQIMDNQILHILDSDKQWVPLTTNAATSPIIPMTYTAKKSFEYYFDWYSIHQINIQLSISTFEVLDVASRTIVAIPMKIANICGDDAEDSN